jgi:hypothetical protein
VTLTPRNVVASAAAAALVLAALVGIVELVGGPGHFRVRDWQIVATTLEVFFCGLSVTLGVRALRASLREATGWLAVVAGIGAFGVFAVGTWWLDGWRQHDEDLGQAVATAVVVLIAALVITGARLLQPRGTLAGFAVFAVVALCVVVDVAIAFADIWSVDPLGGDTGTAAGQLGGLIAAVATIVGVGAFLVLPLIDDLPTRTLDA